MTRIPDGGRIKKLTTEDTEEGSAGAWAVHKAALHFARMRVMSSCCSPELKRRTSSAGAHGS